MSSVGGVPRCGELRLGVPGLPLGEPGLGPRLKIRVSVVRFRPWPPLKTLRHARANINRGRFSSGASNIPRAAPATPCMQREIWGPPRRLSGQRCNERSRMHLLLPLIWFGPVLAA